MEEWKAAADQETGSPDLIQQKLKKKGFNVTRDEVRDYFANKPKPDSESLKIDLNKHMAKEITINKDGTQTSERWIEVYNEEQLKDNEFLLKLHGYDPDEWIVEWAKSTIWQNYSNAQGVTDLYANKITVRRRVREDGLRREDLIILLDELISQRDIPKAEPHIPQGDKALEVNLFDLHFAKLAWAGETGESYDFKIATERFNAVINDVIKKTKGIRIEKIIFPFGQDFYNFNNATGSTEKGTPQDNDLRWKKCFIKGAELIKSGISRLAEIANIDVLFVPGNHGCLLEFCACYAMACYFHNDKRVSIDYGAQGRKYYEYGKVLLGYTHGDKEGKRLEKLMQSEAAEAWGRTKFHEWHTGHFHIEAVKSDIGFKQRTIPSVSGTDAWTYESGYVGTLAQAQSFIWDKEKGLEQIIYSTVSRDSEHTNVYGKKEETPEERFRNEHY